MNSKSKFGKGFGKPYCKETHPDFFKYLQYCKRYISGLTSLNKGEQTPILESVNYTGFLGLLVNIESITILYFKFIHPPSSPLDYLLTYKLCQDHIEQTFCLIRARGGFNDNPTTKQFMYAFRALLIHKELRMSTVANSLPQDSTEFAILSASSTRKRQLNESDTPTDNLFEDWLYDDVNLKGLDSIDHDIITYIAGYVERKIDKILKCNDCRSALYTNETENSMLVEQKRFCAGGLIDAHKDTVIICKTAEQLLRAEQTKIEKGFLEPVKLVKKTMSILYDQNPTLFKGLDDHVMSCPVDENHKFLLMKLIVRCYLTIRSHHMCKLVSESSKKENIRQFSKKMVIFAGQ